MQFGDAAYQPIFSARGINRSGTCPIWCCHLIKISPATILPLRASTIGWMKGFSWLLSIARNQKA
jgi:hypothetical protein